MVELLLRIRIQSKRRSRNASLNLLVVSLILGIVVPICEGILPTAGIEVRYSSGNDSTDPSSNGNGMERLTLWASQASFGTYPSMGVESASVLTPILARSLFEEETNPEELALLCDTRSVTAASTIASSSTSSSSRTSTSSHTALVAIPPSTLLFVPRGNCTFEQKALMAQQLGASAIVIYGTLGSRYNFNLTSQQMIWPANYYDYDCSPARNKQAYIDTSTLQLFPYNPSSNDEQLTGPNSLCAKANPAFIKSCPSQRCLLTGNGTATAMEACCAWDLHIWLYNDPTIDNGTSTSTTTSSVVSIQAYYITSAQMDQLTNILQSYTHVVALPYSRPRPTYNLSSCLLWVLGILVAGLASYLSAVQDYPNAPTANTKKAMMVLPTSNDTHDPTRIADSVVYSELTEQEEDEEELGEHATSATRGPGQSSSTTYYGEETLELTWHHAIGFLVFSSATLFILFFFKIYSVVKVMYGIGCSGALVQVIFAPLYTHLYAKFVYITKKSHTNGGTTQQQRQPPVLFHLFGEEPITIVDILSILTAYGIGIAWIVIGFTTVPKENLSSTPFYWITQDMMGVCMCIVFLGVIRLNSIRVATFLLVAAFFYDIFFVFLTPYLVGKSVMITVATSGGPPTADPSWCEKYPSTPECQGGEPLPMLFSIPRIGDYEGGASLLGLGDIVVPGLLMSFACRIDAAKQQSLFAPNFYRRRKAATAAVTSRLGGFCFRCYCCRGYFIPVLIAYAIGLFMANMAVYLMNMGQPALLYLVPLCLGTICTLGWIRGEFMELWNGPKILVAPSPPPTINPGAAENRLPTVS